jgi:hypothetical protein
MALVGRRQSIAFVLPAFVARSQPIMLVTSHSILTVVSQLQPLLLCYTTGVNKIALIEGFVGTTIVITSTDIRKRGMLTT